eukprot:757153-Hanusia_phi.AAC.3
MVAENFGEACPASAPFFGYMGAAAALIFASESLFLILLSLHVVCNVSMSITSCLKELCLLGFVMIVTSGGEERT